MQIKEVEEKTKLTAKAIRFYEEKGLLSVNRKESGYRDYTDEDVEQLLKIKLLRKCNLSVAEIIGVQNNKLILENVLHTKIKECDLDELNVSLRKELCNDVIKAKGDYKKLYDEIELMESDEYKNFIDEIVDAGHISLAMQCINTIILIGPILSNFIILSMGQYDRLWVSMPFSVLTTVLLTLSWKSFLKDYRYQNVSLLKSIRHVFGVALLIIVLICIMLGTVILCLYMQTKVFMTSDIYMISANRIYSFVFLIIGIECAILFYSFISKYFKHKDYQLYKDVLPYTLKHYISFIFINIILFSIGFFNTTTISKNYLTQYSLFHPTGKSYRYDEIVKVETGYYGQIFSIRYETGEFYYHITMKDGTKIKLEDTQTIKEFEEDSYSEIELFDKDVMKYKPEKISNTKNSKYSLLDQEYIDRFNRIINNK